MTRMIDFYYDFASPNAYVVEAVLPKIAEQYKAKINRIPVLLGGIFKSTGNVPPLERYKDVPNRVQYLHAEMARFTAKHSISFQWTPHFPILSTQLMRAAIFAQDAPWETTFRDCIYHHCWVSGANMNDLDTVYGLLRESDLPADQILEATQNPDIKAALFANTAAAVKRGVFGVPTMFVGEEMFFGKDSLIDLEIKLESI